jgi:putative aminopeptidase FrvX
MGLNYEFFARLINATGPSGYEHDATEVWKKEIAQASDDVTVDVCGSGIARIGAKSGKKVMISTHIDEVGYMVKYIDKGGYIYVEQLGGIDRHIMAGIRVNIKTKKGNVLGVFGRKPIHLIEAKERDSVSKIEDMWIDIGAASDKEAKKLVAIGDCAVAAVGYAELGKEKLIGKGFDDRVGVFVMTEAMKILAKEKLDVSVYGVASTQEELGLRGARTAAYGIAPDYGLVMDVTFASDCPGIDKRKVGDVKLGKGPVITRGPNMHQELADLLVSVAEKNKIPYQMEAIGHATGTDANAIQMTRSGVKTALVSIPNRYMHTPVEVVHKKDVENTVKLVVAFIKKLNAIERG